MSLKNNIDETSELKQGPYGVEKRARAVLEEIYQAAIRAVQPPLLLSKRLKISGSALLVDTKRGRYRFPLTGKIYVVGAGKGADLSAPVFEALFEHHLQEGLLVVRDPFYKGRLQRIAIAHASHPLPDQRSLAETERCMRLLARVKRDDSVLFFLMGGASPLLVQPAPGLTLEDKRSTTDLLLRSGMPIAEINCVRKHLSSIKAGGILRRAYPARVLTLAISDVIGDDPTVLGSAPTFHDPTTYRDAWNVLRQYRLLEKILSRVRNHLRRGVGGEIPETLKPGSRLSDRSPFVLLANNEDALEGAKRRAESLGFAATILTSGLSGDTKTKAKELCVFLKRFVPQNESLRRPHCLLLGGETTVKVRGKGIGGRNQEFALVCAMGLKGVPNLYLLSAGSDGSDGPTDAAGAFADGKSLPRARRLGLDPAQFLAKNDSYNFFQALGDLFRPGPTGTNVLDLKIVLLL